MVSVVVEWFRIAIERPFVVAELAVECQLSFVVVVVVEQRCRIGFAVEWCSMAFAFAGIAAVAVVEWCLAFGIAVELIGSLAEQFEPISSCFVECSSLSAVVVASLFVEWSRQSFGQ